MFCFLCGDPFFIFYLLLFIPVCVISRYYSVIEISSCIFVSVIVYILSTYLNIRLFHVPDIPETIRAFSIQIDKYGYVEWSIKRYYIEIIILTIVGSIFAIERKKELDHKNLMEEISKSVDKITCVNSIIELICEKLNIELGLVISKEGHRLYISHGYSIKKKTSLQSNEFDNPNDMQILNEILKECSTVTINDGIHPKLRSELINAMPGYESIIQ